jgi:hypothetical protein
MPNESYEERRAMNLYEPKHLADSKNTLAIAEDIPEGQYDYCPTHDSRSVRETVTGENYADTKSRSRMER